MNRYLKKIIPIINRTPFFNYLRLGKGNTLVTKSKRLVRCCIDCHGTGNKILLENGGVLRHCKIVIYGNNNTVRIGNFASANDSEIHIEDDNNVVIIGENTALVGACHLACIEGTSIIIGNDCLFSGNITFRTGDSHSVISLDGQRINPSKDIAIGDHVWIGNSTTVLKGGRVGRNSIVSTGAILLNSFSDENVVLAGVPAKIVKSNISWKKERIPIGETL